MDLKRFSTRRTPFYTYDSALLRQTLSAIRAATADTPHFHVHYAVKACATPGVLRIISESGLGADCVSGGEIERAADCGFSPSDIVFAGVGKSDREIEIALELGICCFNVESLPELEVINALASARGKIANVAFRINPNVDAHTHAKITTGLNENKFGLAMEDMLPAIHRAQELPAVRYVGLHFHIGSQITDLEPFEQLAQRVNELQNRLDAAGIKTESINVGGGLGVDYAQPEANPIPDFESYFRIFKDHLELRDGQQVHFELGRSVVAQCGALISRVLYVKHGHEKDFVIVDAGMSDLLRPALYGSVHQARNLSHPEAPSARFDIVGPICESSDVFLSDYTMPSPQRDDLIAFKSAGAYGEIMASGYNCRQLPESWID